MAVKWRNKVCKEPGPGWWMETSGLSGPCYMSSYTTEKNSNHQHTQGGSSSVSRSGRFAGILPLWLKAVGATEGCWWLCRKTQIIKPGAGKKLEEDCSAGAISPVLICIEVGVSLGFQPHTQHRQGCRSVVWSVLWYQMKRIRGTSQEICLEGGDQMVGGSEDVFHDQEWGSGTRLYHFQLGGLE